MKVCLPTIDPSAGGGVLSVSQFVYSVIKDCGHTPQLMYNSTKKSDRISIFSAVKRGMNLWTASEEVNNLDGISTARLALPFEPAQYALSIHSWDNRFDEFDGFFVLGGPCIHAFPLAQSNQTYRCWIGTLIQDERGTQIRSKRQKMKYMLEKPLLQKMEYEVLANSDRVYCQSTYVKNRIKQVHGISGEKLEMLKFPINTDEYRPGEDVSPNLVVTVGRINDPRKNTQFLLESFEILRENVDEVKLLLIGDKPNRQLQKQISARNLEESVVPLGKVPSVIQYLQRASVYVTPSYQEGLGIAGLEAMSCGTPVVSTDCGGPEDYVINGETGYIVPNEEPDTFAERIEDILTNEKKRNRMATNARELVKREYDETEVRNQLRSIFNSYLNE